MVCAWHSNNASLSITTLSWFSTDFGFRVFAEAMLYLLTPCTPLMQTPTSGVRVLWLWRTNSHRLQKSCGEKGTAWPLSKWERGPQPVPGQAFIAFLGTLHRRWSSFTIHRFNLGDYLFTDNKGKNVANYIKEKGYLQMQGERWLNWSHSILSTDFRKLL